VLVTPAAAGPPECFDTPFPEGFRLMLKDFTTSDEVIASDVKGGEVGRATFA
jgi:hypothetical protein